MQRWSQSQRRAGRRIGFVPTMGYLHKGHISLARQARQAVGKNGRVVVSIYVNPAQFGPKEDFSRYPRDLARDKKLCRDAKVDAIFVPSNEEMYPKEAGREYSTYVAEEALAKPMEGELRPGHFRGVTTIVAKLFNLVLPDVAVFGAKDFQQAAVIQRMTRDLNFPIRVMVAPTLREADGLAMSSRNKYLNAAERAQAVVLHQSLAAARKLVEEKGPVPAKQLRQAMEKVFKQAPLAKLQYIEVFDPDTLERVKTAQAGCQVALAAHLGATRLIDNATL